MRSALFWDLTQRRMVVYYRRFGTTNLYHLQGSGSPKRFFLECVASVANCDSALRKIPEERRSHRPIRRLHRRTFITPSITQLSPCMSLFEWGVTNCRSHLLGSYRLHVWHYVEMYLIWNCLQWRLQCGVTYCSSKLFTVTSAVRCDVLLI